MHKNQKGLEMIATFERFDKNTKKDTYKLLDVSQGSRFRVVTYQVDLPEIERNLLDQQIVKKAFMN